MYINKQPKTTTYGVVGENFPNFKMEPTPDVTVGNQLRLRDRATLPPGSISVAFVGGTVLFADRQSGQAWLKSSMRGFLELESIHIYHNTRVFTTGDDIVSLFSPGSNRITIINVHKLEPILFDGFIFVDENTGVPTRTISTGDSSVSVCEHEVTICACAITADDVVAFVGGLGFLVRIILVGDYPPTLIARNIMCASVSMSNKHLFVATRNQVVESSDILNTCVLREVGTPFDNTVAPQSERMDVDSKIDVDAVMKTRDVSHCQITHFKPLLENDKIERIVATDNMLIVQTVSFVFLFSRLANKWIGIGEVGIHPNSASAHGNKLAVLCIKDDKPLLVAYDCITGVCTQHAIHEDALVSLPHEKRYLHPEIGITTLARLQLDEEHQEGQKQRTQLAVQMCTRDHCLLTFIFE